MVVEVREVLPETLVAALGLAFAFHDGAIVHPFVLVNERDAVFISKLNLIPSLKGWLLLSSFPNYKTDSTKY